MPPAPEPFDAVLIGAGQAGNPLSRSLAKAGWRVALIERDQVGGSCVNRGCTPTKTMVASARIAYLAGRAADYGVHVGPVTVNLPEVRARKDAIVEKFRHGSERSIEKADNVELIRGDAAFTGPKSVRVTLKSGGVRELTAPVILINTGTRPATPDLPGLDGIKPLDSTSIMELGEIPERLIVLGGGYIGLEFAQMFRRFGSHVTIVHKGEHLLAREDSDIADAVAEILREDGVEVLLNAAAERVTPTPGGLTLVVKSPDGRRELAGSHLLVAVGQVPNTDTLNLKAAGVESDKDGYVAVNDKLETNVPGIYAAGDVNGGPAFTHVSHHDNQILRENLLHAANRTTAGRLVPYTVFLDPQLGRVGMTESQAREAGHTVRVARLPMSKVHRALESGEPRGALKAVVDGDSGLILGAACLGMEGGEIMAMLQIAMMGGVRFERLRDDMFAHPTLAEGLNSLFAQFEGE